MAEDSSMKRTQSYRQGVATDDFASASDHITMLVNPTVHEPARDAGAPAIRWESNMNDAVGTSTRRNSAASPSQANGGGNKLSRTRTLSNNSNLALSDSDDRDDGTDNKQDPPPPRGRMKRRASLRTHGVSSILEMQAKGEVSFDSIHREIKEAEHEQLKRKKSTESTSFGNYARDGASSPARTRRKRRTSEGDAATLDRGSAGVQADGSAMHNESTFHAFDEDEFKEYIFRPRPTKLISRGHAYLQYNVSAKERGSWFMNFYQRFTESWWHTVIHLNITPLFALIFFSYMLVFVAFVPVYMAISDNCGLKIGEDSGEPFLDALYLSVETMTTIGYGVPDQYYNGCPEGLICVVGQSLIGFMMNAVLFGTVFTRIARSHGRGNAIKFSLKAIVRKIRGRYFIMFQVVDARTTQALQVSMKLWCVRHDWIGENPCQLVSMRCLQPNDSVSTYLLLATPNLIVHEIDVWSPLHPPRDSNEPIASDASYEYQWPSPPMRSDDSRRAERSEYACRVCGEMFTVATYLKQHISYCVNGQEEDMSTKCEHCDMTFSCREELVAHRMCSHNNKQLTLPELKEQRPELYHNHTFFYNGDGNPHADMKTWPENAPAKVSKDQIRTWLLLSQPEMIAIVAGVDPVTGANFEAVQSYTHEDIIWDHRFVNCVERPTPLSKDEHEGRVTVDYSLFDKIVPCEDVPVGADVGKGEIVSHV